jgi:SulP family sulfate permease
LNANWYKNNGAAQGKNRQDRGYALNPGNSMEQVGAAAQNLKPQREHLISDAMAGLTFAVVNVPQAMAHALLAMVNPVLGIYTLMVAIPIGAIFTSSAFMNVSTTSALSVATAAGLADISAAQRLPSLAALVLLTGVIQLLAGLFRLGFLVRFVSNSVMTGFLNGVAVLVILGQLGDLTGYHSAFSNRVARALDLFLHLGAIDVPTTIIGGLTLALIVLLLRTRWRKFAFIIAIGIATTLLALLSVPALGTARSWETVRTVGEIASIPRTLPQLALPTPALLLTMLLPALSMAIIGLTQGAGVSQGYPNPDGKYPVVSRDFFGQGAANIATSFVGGIPAGGSVSGTVLIMSAGARSRWANILAGIFVAVIVLLAAPLVELIPMPSLAALLIVLPSRQFTMLQIYGSLFFAAAKNLEEMLPTVDQTTRAVVALGLRGSPEVGSTFISVLQRYAEALQAHDSKLMLVGIDQAVHEQLAKTGVLTRIGEENVFLATPQLGEAMNQAAAAAYAWLGQSLPGPAASNPVPT